LRPRIPFANAKLCVVGNVNRDVKVHDAPGSKALLRDGETAITAVTESIGGGGANSACAAAALGAGVYFVGKVGADSLGAVLKRAMERHGVKTRLTVDNKCSTGTTVALDFETGHRHFLSCLPNNRNVTFADLDLSALKKCEHLLRADVWFSRQMLETGNELLLFEARRLGLTTSLDINFDPAWSSGAVPEIRRRKRLLRKVLGSVDIAHGNVRELCEFTETADLGSALKKLESWGVGSVVVHLGNRGAGFYRKGKLIIEPASRARRTVHSTGTGDVLSICMILLARNDRLSIREKLRRSNQVVREFMEGRRKLIPAL
jgi:sugar/nucleoside kinase (ribokinase family)